MKINFCAWVDFIVEVRTAAILTTMMAGNLKVRL
jgi:hypothetical protein